MVLKYHLGITDYAVIAVSLLISVIIGVISKYYGNPQKTAKDFLLAGRNMYKIPVIFSIVVTLTSPSSMIGSPIEVYRYGLKFITKLIAMPIGMFLASSLLLPVYFQCGVSTVNEYLEMRFGKIIKYITSALFLVQMIIYMSVALYGCVLALSAVTNLSMEMSIISLGGICVFYCSLGGLKAVLWTDVYQASLMIICFLAIYIAGVGDAGGISKTYYRAKEGQRLDIFYFPFDLTKRYGFWASASHGLLLGLGFYGTNQIEVQRMLSLSCIKRAKSTIRWSSIPATGMYLVCCFFGIFLYSIHYHCDPILNKEQTGLRKYDQILPAYIVTRFSSIPGLTGLCVAGIFSAALSTISSALNSAATVTVVDFIKPLFQKGNISELKIVWLAKAMSVLYGIICVGLSFIFLNASSLLQTSQVLVNLLIGPMLGVFLVGVLTRKASDKTVSIAFIGAYSILTWISIGSLASGYIEAPLPLSTSMCSSTYNASNYLYSSPGTKNGNYSSLSISPQVSSQEIFYLYKISFNWYSFLGCLLTLFFVFLAVLATGWKRNVIPPNSKCLSPVVRLWTKTTVQDDVQQTNDDRVLKECAEPKMSA